MKDDTLIKVALAGLIAYELGSGRAGIGSGRGIWFAREERPVAYWLLVSAHLVVLGGIMVADFLTHGHP